MVVGAEGIVGTIGGGALEYMVIARARQALRDGLPPGVMDVPLGPEIGQCCGGRVTVSLRVVGPAEAERLTARVRQQEAALPRVYVFGAGHVGKALARALAALPVQVQVIDTRTDELHDLPDGVEA
jgi:xanthine dehydrogenase accessory factor